MKAIPTLCVALLVVAGLPHALADDGEGSSQHISQTIELIPTLDAPLEAGGEAKLKAHDSLDATEDTSGLTVTPTGLLSGTYDVSATLKSSGSSVFLGTVVVDGTNDATVVFGKLENPYPLDFNSYDVAEVVISTPGVSLIDPLDDVVYLVGDFTDPTTSIKSKIHVNKPLVLPDTVIPSETSPKGRLVINGRYQKDKVRALINFKVHQLTPDTDYTLVVNGLTTDSIYTSDAQGKLFLKQTPGNSADKGKGKGKGKKKTLDLNPFAVQSISLINTLTLEVVITGEL